MAKTENYDEFIEKFKPKKTTDDCYTPPKVYQTILDWCVEEYGIDRDKVVRPFYPDGDYENFDYSNGAVVVDNPPFSILKKIKDFYCERKIPFFLFGPGLTMINKNDSEDICYIFTGIDITYENGAKVNTGFVTNLDEYRLRLSQTLRKRIQKVEENKKTNLIYSYPPNVLNGALASKYLNKGIEFNVKASERVIISRLDAQKPCGKTIYGSAFLLSERKTEELKNTGLKAKTEDYVWELSGREKKMIAELE